MHSSYCIINYYISGITNCIVIHMQVRDPPPEGELFIYGTYIWGCGFEKSTNIDFEDIPPKQIPVPLPVLHLSVVIQRSPATDQTSQSGNFAMEQKGPYILHSPCFCSNNARFSGSDVGKKKLFSIAFSNSEVTPAKWATRNIACTLRPF